MEANKLYKIMRSRLVIDFRETLQGKIKNQIKFEFRTEDVDANQLFDVTMHFTEEEKQNLLFTELTSVDGIEFEDYTINLYNQTILFLDDPRDIYGVEIEEIEYDSGE